MTDIIQELIDRGHRVAAYRIEQGWLEFDTDTDFELYHSWAQRGTLPKFIRL